MIAGTLWRYFAMRFVASVVGSFLGVIALAAMIDYVELMRRAIYRVPQLAERNPALHGAGGRDVVLPDAFAPA